MISKGKLQQLRALAQHKLVVEDTHYRSGALGIYYRALLFHIQVNQGWAFDDQSCMYHLLVVNLVSQVKAHSKALIEEGVAEAAYPHVSPSHSPSGPSATPAGLPCHWGLFARNGVAFNIFDARNGDLQ